MVKQRNAAPAASLHCANATAKRRYTNHEFIIQISTLWWDSA